MDCVLSTSCDGRGVIVCAAFLTVIQLSRTIPSETTRKKKKTAMEGGESHVVMHIQKVLHFSCRHLSRMGC